MTDQTELPRAVPARRRPVYEGPLFWLGLIAFGLVLAGALSFLPARGDTAEFKPDEAAFCAQVDVLGSTDLLSLVAGATALPQVPFGGGSTTTTGPVGEAVPGAALDELTNFEQQRVQLERVAPHEVRTDVHDVRLQIDDVMTSLRRVGATNGVPASSLFFAISDAQTQIQQSIGRMSTYVSDTCGVDLRPTSLLPGSFSN
jgi:hypothetical protein